LLSLKHCHPSHIHYSCYTSRWSNSSRDGLPSPELGNLIFLKSDSWTSSVEDLPRGAPVPSYVPLLLILLVGLASLLVVHVGFAQCQGGFSYIIEAESGGYYALVGLPLDLRSQYANHTTRIFVSGTYYPSNPTQYLHPEPNFRGLIYVTQYVINGVTFTYAQTVVMVSGSVTSTSTLTNQISPTTITAATGTVTLTLISVSGLLDYTQQYCVTTPLTTTSSSSIGGNPSLTIPGFTAVAVILGLLMGLSFLVARRKSASCLLHESEAVGLDW
jgi:hypothetical protein